MQQVDKNKYHAFVKDVVLVVIPSIQDFIKTLKYQWVK